MALQNPFVPWLGLSPWSSTTTSLASILSTPTATSAIMPTETTEFLKAWAYDEQSAVVKWFKGVAAGVAASLLLASLCCCWAPCVYWYYGGDFSQRDALDDMTDAMLRGQFVPEGGWGLWLRGRGASDNEGVGVPAGDARGYERNPDMTTARNRNERRAMGRRARRRGRQD
ncbi:uncharacterized protein LY79DRAFT_406189 [Colletotrichum navitas]|uniref:Uncharacterized protein n=1 Tax=Colletotrichum navitas TaxID=681940 RepID=A0AAD8Q8H7_9PEZI|nr:uncharacterized protein LY79DRAFT_406189 [Colletotrichum navitas]KAK1597161.1 hypothetical protein LY79DRAFT_406189 [Colletotrichum navitas]